MARSVCSRPVSSVGTFHHRNRYILSSQPSQSSQSGNDHSGKFVLGGLLSLLGLEKSEDDPITKSMKIAILSIQVQEQSLPS